MRHGKKINHLGRTSSHRKAMMANMASSLILHKRISTTTAKAKALKTYVEPLITKAKDDHTHSRRMVFSYLQNKEAVAELFRDVAEKVGERAGGYTRILKTGNRQGDNAEMCYLELVDYNETYSTEKAQSDTSKRRRRRRSGKKKPQSEQKTSQQQGVEAQDQPNEEARSQQTTEDTQEESADQALDQKETSQSKEKQVKAQKNADDQSETQQEEEKGEKEEKKADDASEGEKKE